MIVAAPIIGLAILFGLWRFGYFGDPRFIRDVEPDYAHRVLVNRCCGGSMSGTEPLEIFYGSTEPFETVVEHYRTAMASHGYLMYTAPFARDYGRESYDFEKKGWHHCFTIEPYSDKNLGWVQKSDVAGLSNYPYAYVATYLNFCDLDWSVWPYSAQLPACRQTPERCYPPETKREIPPPS
jgi:hypothetical protein